MLDIFPCFVNIISNSVGSLFSSLMESFHEHKFFKSVLSAAFLTVIAFYVLFKNILSAPGVMKISYLFFWKLYCLGLHIMDPNPSGISFDVQREVGVMILPVVPARFADVTIFSLLDCSAAFILNPVSIGVLLEDSPFCSTGPCVCP